MSALDAALEFAVAFHIEDLRGKSPEELREIAREGGEAAAFQGDVMLFGGATKWGHGARQKAKHEEHAHLVTEENREEWGRKCRVCLTGAPQYSPGELFNLFVRGIAAAAYAPGGITFRSMHWEVTDDTRTAAAPGDPPVQDVRTRDVL